MGSCNGGDQFIEVANSLSPPSQFGIQFSEHLKDVFVYVEDD